VLGGAIELTELSSLRKKRQCRWSMEPMELTELMELRKNMLMEHGADVAHRAHGAEKEYAY